MSEAGAVGGARVDPGGRVLVLVHGAGGRGALWAPQVGGLEDLARILAPDLPGHGDTPGPGRTRIEDYAAWLMEWLDAQGVGPVVLAGHSMGGAIAQTVALTWPERLAGLVLVGTGARLRVLPRILELFREDPPRGCDVVGSLAYAAATPRARVAAADRALRETSPLVTLGDFLACDRFDVMDRVGDIRTPTLVVVGREDRLTPPRYAAYLASRIRGARLLEVEGAGHFPQLEQPDTVNAALRDFLRGLP